MDKNKKILILRHKLTNYGGAELVFIKEAEYFSKRGYEVFGAVFNVNKEIFGKYMVYFRDFFIPAKSGFWREVFGLRKFIKKIGSDVVIAHENGHIHLFFAKMFLKKKPVCISHMYGSFMWLVGSKLSQSFFYRKDIKKIAAEIITAYYDFNKGIFERISVYKRLRAELHAWLDFLAVRSFDKVITCCESTARELSIIYKIKPVIISGGVDAEKAPSESSLRVKEVMRKFNLPAGKKIILTVNRLDERKRIDLLIESFLKMSDKRKDAILVVAGTGPEEKKLKLMVSPGNKKIFFTGFVPEEFLKGLYFISEVVVYSAWCNWGLVPLECLVLDKKVVISKDAFIQEGVADIPNVFVNNPNRKDLAEALVKALDAPAKKSKEIIEKRLSWEVYFGSISRLF